MTQKRIPYIYLVSILQIILIGCSNKKSQKENNTIKLKNQNIDIDKKKDTFFLGFWLEMNKQEFFNHAIKLKKEKIISGKFESNSVSNIKLDFGYIDTPIEPIFIDNKLISISIHNSLDDSYNIGGNFFYKTLQNKYDLPELKITSKLSSYYLENNPDYKPIMKIDLNPKSVFEKPAKIPNIYIPMLIEDRMALLPDCFVDKNTFIPKKIKLNVPRLDSLTDFQTSLPLKKISKEESYNYFGQKAYVNNNPIILDKGKHYIIIGRYEIRVTSHKYSYSLEDDPKIKNYKPLMGEIYWDIPSPYVYVHTNSKLRKVKQYITKKFSIEYISKKHYLKKLTVKENAIKKYEQEKMKAKKEKDKRLEKITEQI